MTSPEQETRQTKTKKKRPAWLLVLLDLMLTGLVLCVFATFHHVIPSIQRRLSGPITPIATIVPSAAPTQRPQTEDGEEAEPEPDPNDWRVKFAEHFTDEVIVTENSYASPNISITISTHFEEAENHQVRTWYVADIYIAQIENFQTCFSNARYHESAESLSEQYGFILGVNGDYATNQSEGLLVRNGQIYLDEQTANDICVLYYDGTMETYGAEEYIASEILERDVYQSWKFGPELLEPDGSPKTSFNTTYAIESRNPRTGLGYYEPGHYCFVVMDGRQDGYSNGIPMDGFARIFSELGCVSAYNMDGGDSTIMMFNGSRYNTPSHGGRNLGDMLYITELTAGEPAPEEGEG